MTPAGTSNELDVQNEWEENTNTHTFKLSQLFVEKNNVTAVWRWDGVLLFSILYGGGCGVWVWVRGTITSAAGCGVEFRLLVRGGSK